MSICRLLFSFLRGRLNRKFHCHICFRNHSTKLPEHHLRSLQQRMMMTRYSHLYRLFTQLPTPSTTVTTASFSLESEYLYHPSPSFLLSFPQPPATFKHSSNQYQLPTDTSFSSSSYTTLSYRQLAQSKILCNQQYGPPFYLHCSGCYHRRGSLCCCPIYSTKPRQWYCLAS